MPELPIISGRECIRALGKIGYVEARTRGSHVRLRCPGRRISEVNLTVEEFVELLNR
jgi:predicted RNA binding protein YcfA (HicA-like mRNA interferase family)